MCVTGHDNEPGQQHTHAARMLELAAALMAAAKKVRLPEVPSPGSFLLPAGTPLSSDVVADLSRRRIRVRMGVHTGAAKAGSACGRGGTEKGMGGECSGLGCKLCVRPPPPTAA